MNTTHKDNNLSNIPCYQCSDWKDYNGNGIGSCNNSESQYNHTFTHAMDTCDAANQKELPKEYWAVILKTRNETPQELTVASQRTEIDAWESAKQLAMDYCEAIADTQTHHTVNISISKPKIKIASNGLPLATHRIEKREVEQTNEKLAD